MQSLKIGSVLLSTSVKRFSVSCMRDFRSIFFLIYIYIYLSLLCPVWELPMKLLDTATNIRIRQLSLPFIVALEWAKTILNCHWERHYYSWNIYLEAGKVKSKYFFLLKMQQLNNLLPVILAVAQLPEQPDVLYITGCNNTF